MTWPDTHATPPGRYREMTPPGPVAEPSHVLADVIQHGRGLKGSLEWLAFVANLPARIEPINVPLGGGLVVPGRGILTGVNLINSATAASTVTLIDGQDSKGLNIAQYTVAGSGNLSPNFPVKGVLVEIGVFLSYSGGLISGSVYVVPLWRYPFTAPGE